MITQQDVVKMVRELFFIFGVIFLFGFVGAVTLNQGIVLNTTTSNSSINFSFSINTSNFTIESNYVLLYGINFTNSTGTYTCDDVNHSESNSLLDSSDFTCSISTTSSNEESSSSSSGRGGGNWMGIREQENVKENKLVITVGVGKNNPLNKNIESNLTGLREIEINSNERIYGTIEFKVLEEIPDNCKIDENYVVYELFEINENFNISDFESIKLKYGVNKNWIKENKIKEIKAIKCLPHYENISIEKLNESGEEEYFNIYSNSFSTWVILGTKEENNVGIEKEKSEDVSIEDSFFEQNWYGGLLLILLFIIIYFIFNKKVKKRIKRKHEH